MEQQAQRRAVGSMCECFGSRRVRATRAERKREGRALGARQTWTSPSLSVFTCAAVRGAAAAAAAAASHSPPVSRRWWGPWGRGSRGEVAVLAARREGKGRAPPRAAAAERARRRSGDPRRRRAPAPEEGPMDMRGCAATPRRPSGHLQKQNGYRESQARRQMDPLPPLSLSVHSSLAPYRYYVLPFHTPNTSLTYKRLTPSDNRIAFFRLFSLTKPYALLYSFYFNGTMKEMAYYFKYGQKKLLT